MGPQRSDVAIGRNERSEVRALPFHHTSDDRCLDGIGWSLGSFQGPSCSFVPLLFLLPRPGSRSIALHFSFDLFDFETV